MWCTGAFWNSWGMPWIMFLIPLLFLAVMFLACRFFRPRVAGCCGWHHPIRGDWAREIDDLRRDVDELRNGKPR